VKAELLLSLPKTSCPDPVVTPPTAPDPAASMAISIGLVVAAAVGSPEADRVYPAPVKDMYGMYTVTMFPMVA